MGTARSLAFVLLGILILTTFGTVSGSSVVFHTGFEFSSQPNNLTAMPTTDYVDLSWDVPIDDYDHTISSYLVYRSDGGHVYPERTTLVATVDAATLGYRDDTVVNGEEYTYYVVAKATDGTTSPNSNWVTVFVGHTVPSAPNNLRAVPMNASVELTWTAPDNPGGVYYTSYKVYRISATDNWTVAKIVSADSYTYPDVIDDGLTNGMNYTYVVRAVNVFGEGTGAVVNATPNYAPSDIFFSPQFFAGDFSDSDKELTFTVTWTAASNTSTITHYVVYVQRYEIFPTEGVDVGLNTTYTLTGTVRELQNAGIRIAAVHADDSESFSERSYMPVYMPVDGPIGGFWEAVVLIFILPALLTIVAIALIVRWVKKRSK